MTGVTATGRRTFGIVTTEPEFSPEDISGLQAWWDYSDSSTLFTDSSLTTPVSSDGDTILGVADKSAANNDQSRASGGPTYKVNIQNGLSGAFHTRASVNYLVVSTMDPADLKPCSVFYVVQSQANFAAGSGAILGTDSAGDRLRHYLAGTTGKQQTDIPNVANLLTATNSWNVSTTRVGLWTYGSAGAIAYYMDGTANGSGTSNQTFAGTGLRVGHAQQDGGIPGDGYFFEILIYNSVLSTDDLNTVGDYLAAKWNLTWTGI